MKRFRVTGPGAELRVALDRIHVFVEEVCGVLDETTGFDVYVRGELPDLAGVQVEALPLPVESPTGREGDVPILIGSAILVRPPWVSAPTGFTGIELVVPRAMAFGSGEHGSTRAALILLEQVFTPQIQSLADIGTGSGILALYAQARGCPRIAACDLDPVASTAAGELLADAEVVTGGPEALSGRFDCVVANMRGTEILACLDAILARWNRRAPLILSGLRSDECDLLSTAVGRTATTTVACSRYHALAF